MKNRFLSVLVLAALVLTLLAGCAGLGATEPTTVTNYTPEQAQEIVREALGITEEQMLSPMIHIGEFGDPAESCYSIQFATLEMDYEFVVSAVTGQILYRSDEAQ